MNEDEKILEEYGGSPCVYNDDGILMGSGKIGLLQCNKCKNYFSKEQIDIFCKLMASGADAETAIEVITNKNYFEQYKSKKENGVSDLEIALELRKEISGY